MEIAVIGSQRRDRILRELALRGSLRVREFADLIGVSGMTLRRDLEELEAKNLLQRVHGGAVSLAVAAAQSPAGRESSHHQRRPLATIGMVVPSANYYFPEVIRGAGVVARELGCQIVLAVSNYSIAEEIRQIEGLLRGKVDGLLVTPSNPLSESPEVQRLLAEAQIPVVMVERSLDNEPPGGHLECVRNDHSYGAELAVAHLAGLGHQRIALGLRDTPTAPWLIEGHARSASRLGLDPELLVRSIARDEDAGSNSRESLEKLLDECVSTGTRAAVILTDADAISLVSIALERGLRIPEDFAVVAYDDEVAEHAAVPLTAIAPAKHDLGRIAMRTCFERISNAVDEPSAALGRVALLPTLVIRESTDLNVH